MVPVGVTFIIFGVIGFLWSQNTMDSFEYAWDDFWGGSEYDFAEVMYYLSIILCIAGTILFFMGYFEKIIEAINDLKNSQSNNNQKQNNNSMLSNSVAAQSGGIQGQQTKNCVHCNFSINVNATKCPYCGADNVTNNAISSQSLPNTTVNLCNVCGNKVGADDDFCMICGTKVTR